MPPQQIPNNAVRQVLILGTILFLGVVLFRHLQSFLPAFLGAYTLYVLLRKWMFILESRKKIEQGAGCRYTHAAFFSHHSAALFYCGGYAGQKNILCPAA